MNSGNRYILDKFNVRILGEGEPTLVIAHGFGSNQKAWTTQAEALRQAGRIVLFDHVGCGDIDTDDFDPEAYSDLDRHRDNILSIYKALDLKYTIFIGHSVSAMLGISASLKRPEYFRKLALVGASPRYLNDGDYFGGFDRQDLDLLYEAMAASYLDWAIGFGHAAMGNPERPSLGEMFAQTLSSMRPDVAQSVARGIFESDYRAILPLITHPVLILQSQNDIAVPVSVGEYLAAHIPNSKFVLLDAFGHHPHLSAPEQVKNELLAFVDHF